jgi:hypothetical protein
MNRCGYFCGRFFSFVLVATWLTACSQASASPPVPTAPPLVPTESVPPHREITPTPAQGVTPGVTTTPLVAGVEIDVIGSERFLAQTSAALGFLQDCARDALAGADEQLNYIVEADRSGAYVEDGGFAASDITAFAPNFSAPAQVYWYAGTIVHDARHRWQNQHGLTTDWDAMTLEERQAIEADARGVQIDALQACSTAVPQAARHETDYMLKYLTDMQAGITACDYCEVEWADRDW